MLGALLVLSGCIPGIADEQPIDEVAEPEEDPTPAPLEADKCNTKADSSSVTECALTLGAPKLEYIGLPGDQDWYTVQLPAGLTARSLVHVSAGYSAPNTAVNLQVNLMRADGVTSLAQAIDKHGQGAPKVLDLIVPFSEGGAKLVLLVNDASSKPAYDSRSPYHLLVEVIENPDANEPNDVTPTPVPLTASGDKLVGTQTGFLATAGDVDRFTLQLPAGRKVAYLHLTSAKLSPPPPYRLSYTILDPSKKPVAEGRMDNEFLAVDLATARIFQGGEYTLVVQGYNGDPTKPVPGDLRLKYTLDVQVLSEVDANEPNDTLETATNTNFAAPGASATLTGRMDHVPDPEWFSFTLAPSSEPTVLYYKVTPGSTGGRFPALPGSKDRQVRVFTVVTQGATAGDRSNACRTNAQVCPRRPDMDDSFTSGLVDAFCGMGPARCLNSSREEEENFAALRNFEGALPVAPHSQPLKYYVLYGDDQSNWADDKDFTVRVEWRADADEAGRFSGGAEQTQVRALAVDDAASGFPTPPSGSAFELEGKLSYGFGFYRNHDPLKGEGVRGPRDYDGFASDTDSYELDFPAGLAAPLDRTWELQWEVAKPPGGGGAPYDLILEVTFCDGSGAPGSCQKTTKQIGYKGGDLGSWHSTGVQGATRQPVYSLDDNASARSVTALAYGCFCFERRFIQGGKFFINVIGVDRDSYAEMPYKIRTALTGYPKAYNGGQCPAVVPNGAAFEKGCEFAKQ